MEIILFLLFSAFSRLCMHLVREVVAAQVSGS